MAGIHDQVAHIRDAFAGSVGTEGGGAASPPWVGEWAIGGSCEQALEYGAMSERMRRVNESERQVLAEALPELKDPRLGLITVTGVDTAPDLRHATVYVSVLGSGRKQRASILGLEAAHGVLQSRLARELRLKRTPQLTFEYDPTVERGVRMTRLIDELAPDDE